MNESKNKLIAVDIKKGSI